MGMIAPSPDITRIAVWPQYVVEPRPGTAGGSCAPHEVIDTHQPGRVVVFASEHKTCWFDRNNRDLARYVATYLNWKDRDPQGMATIAPHCERLIAAWQGRQVAA